MRDSATNRLFQSLARACSISGFAICALVLATASAVLVPQLTRASGRPEHSPDAIVGMLRYVRAQIQVYRQQHDGRPPGVLPGGTTNHMSPGETFVAQMTGCTDIEGAVGPGRSKRYALGPYLAAMPANPVTMRDGVLIVPGPVFPAADNARAYGWMYCPQTQQLVANAEGVGPDGVPYTSY